MFRTDQADTDVVILCSCGWRTLVLSRPAVTAAMDHHRRQAHPADKKLAQQVAARKRRQR